MTTRGLCKLIITILGLFPSKVFKWVLIKLQHVAWAKPVEPEKMVPFLGRRLLFAFVVKQTCLSKHDHLYMYLRKLLTATKSEFPKLPVHLCTSVPKHLSGPSCVQPCTCMKVYLQVVKKAMMIIVTHIHKNCIHFLCM